MHRMPNAADAIETAVLTTPGHTDRVLREAILTGAGAAWGWLSLPAFPTLCASRTLSAWMCLRAWGRPNMGLRP